MTAGMFIKSPYEKQYVFSKSSYYFKKQSTSINNKNEVSMMDRLCSFCNDKVKVSRRSSEISKHQLKKIFRKEKYTVRYKTLNKCMKSTVFHMPISLGRKITVFKSELSFIF